MRNRVNTICHASRQFVAALLLVCAAGCGGGRTITLDEDVARQSLSKALDMWKAGGHAEDLRQQAPAIAVNDLDWSQGHKLTAFHVEGPGTSNGRNLRVPVTLTVLQPPRGTAKKITATYAIGVDPSVVIVRETEGD
jgi:hypothetical protein